MEEAVSCDNKKGRSGVAGIGNFQPELIAVIKYALLGGLTVCGYWQNASKHCPSEVECIFEGS